MWSTPRTCFSPGGAARWGLGWVFSPVRRVVFPLVGENGLARILAGFGARRQSNGLELVSAGVSADFAVLAFRY